MGSPSGTDASHVYQLKVSLRGISPMVWRRLLVPDAATIADLHHILQIAMGWEDFHLHKFDIHGKEYGISYEGGIGFSDNPRKVRLSDFAFRIGDRFFYEYDFGDSWQHEIRIEKLTKEVPRKPWPVCVEGKRACPPEDCGGPWGYMEILHILKRRYHPDKSRVQELVESSFDPNAYRRRDVNSALREYWKNRDGSQRSTAC